MIIPQYIRFYSGYTAQSVLNEFAVTFFALVNSMWRIQADEMLAGIIVESSSMMEPKDKKVLLNQLEKSSKGISGIIQEVRNIKK